MTKDRKEYMKAWNEAHKEARKASAKAWYEANKEARKAYYQANKEEITAKKKAYQKANKDQYKANMKAYYEANKEEITAKKKAYRQAHKDQAKARMKSDLNSLGETKHSIRMKSRYILKQMHLHIKGYEIHHCFTYDDPAKFIYISKSLHLKIHQFLRDNNIDADSDHWMQIRDIVNDTDEFTYIKC